MIYRVIIATAIVLGTSSLAHGLLHAAPPIIYSAPVVPETNDSMQVEIPPPPLEQITPSNHEPAPQIDTSTEPKATPKPKRVEATKEADTKSDVFTVPFFSQFADITPVEWRKVGCGIASLAMLIEFYEPGAVSVDTLLKEGISAGAFLSSAGWTHAGLINLSKKYGLSGSSHDMAGLSMSVAFDKLQTILEEGPVMVSVHYTFDPKNPIPHLVVVNGVRDGKVYYNDPSEKTGGGSISIAKFQSSWKKRYIEIHPIS